MLGVCNACIKKTQQPGNIQWLRVILMSRGFEWFEWMIGTVDKHTILYKSHYHCCGLVGVIPFSFHLSLSLFLSCVFFDHILF